MKERRLRIYVASSWRNTYQQAVVEGLRIWGHDVYDFRNQQSAFAWADVDTGWQGWTAFEFFNALFHNLLPRAAFVHDMKALKRATDVVLVLPSGRSAHMEAGIAIGMGKRLWVYAAPGDRVEPEVMYLACCGVVTDLGKLAETIEQRAEFDRVERAASRVKL